MNKPKLLRMIFALSIVLAVFFGIGLLVADMKDHSLVRIGLWCGFISQLLLAVSMYLEIRKH